MQKTLQDFSKVTTNKQVIDLLKQREELEQKIRSMDGMALLLYELHVLDQVETSTTEESETKKKEQQ